MLLGMKKIMTYKQDKQNEVKFVTKKTMYVFGGYLFLLGVIMGLVYGNVLHS